MSEPLDASAGDGLGAAEEAVRPAEPETVEGTGTAADESMGEPGADGDSFPRAYVEQLREEAAANRVRAARADEAIEALYEAARELGTAGILYDPTDLARSDDHLDTETGLPNVGLIREAAMKLADEKPHLSRARGAIGQGPRGQFGDGFTLAGALRDAAR